MMSDKVFYMCFYLCLFVASGVGEYFHLVPLGSTSIILGGILGHGISAFTNGKNSGVHAPVQLPPPEQVIL